MGRRVEEPQCTKPTRSALARRLPALVPRSRPPDRRVPVVLAGTHQHELVEVQIEAKPQPDCIHLSYPYGSVVLSLELTVEAHFGAQGTVPVR